MQDKPSTARCIECEKQLTGRQVLYCSRSCKNRRSNRRYQAYLRQQERARTNKLRLVILLGGRCLRCGYRRNLAALEFHHREPSQKLMSLEARNLANRHWADIEAEARKCDLLCSNCHAEHHHPGDRLEDA